MHSDNRLDEMTLDNSVPRRIADAIRDVLNRDWDPIGMMGDPEWPCDEYDSYIGDLYRYLARGESAAFIARHLCFIEEHCMGFRHRHECTRMHVAEKLVAVDIPVA